MSLIISAFAKIDDARRALTPELRLDRGPTALLLVDLGAGKNRLGGSVLAQTEASAVVASMPAAVARAGLADADVPLDQIGSEQIRWTNTGRRRQ